VTVVETENGRVQVSMAPETDTVGLLVERDGLFGGTLLTRAQAEKLARVLLKRNRLSQSADM
jgi:hypothetical protein